MLYYYSNYDAIEHSKNNTLLISFDDRPTIYLSFPFSLSYICIGQRIWSFALSLPYVVFSTNLFVLLPSFQSITSQQSSLWFLSVIIIQPGDDCVLFSSPLYC